MAAFLVVFCDPEAQGAQGRPTGVIEQGSSPAVGCGCDQVPDKALDVLIPSVVIEAVHQDGSADGLYILLGELAFVASMGQDIRPAAPAGEQKGSMQMESQLQKWHHPDSWAPVLGNPAPTMPLVTSNGAREGMQVQRGTPPPYRGNDTATEAATSLMAFLGCWWLGLSFLGNAYNQRNWNLSSMLPSTMIYMYLWYPTS